MAKVMAAVNGASTTDAEFRTWGSWIHAGLVLCGLVQTADTGQINWTTVLKPTAINTNSGYEIWTFADSLQASAPVYIKIEYGKGSSSGPALWIQISTSSNGSGTLNGAQSSPRTMVTATSVPSSSGSWLISGSTNRLLIVLPIDIAASGYCWVSIERSHNSVGTDTTAGVTWLSESAGGTYVQYYFPLNGGASPGSAGAPGVFPPTFGTGTDGSVTAVYPVFVDKGGPWMNPLKNVVAVFLSNFTPNSVVPITMYGANRNYYVPQSGFLGQFTRYTVANTVKPVFLYE